MGAFLSMDIDAFDMGRQAGEMVLEILAGKRDENIKQAYARKANISTNAMIAEKFRLRSWIAMNRKRDGNEKIFRKSRAIY